jgi:hypothetical protein
VNASPKKFGKKKYVASSWAANLLPLRSCAACLANIQLRSLFGKYSEGSFDRELNTRHNLDPLHSANACGSWTGPAPNWRILTCNNIQARWNNQKRVKDGERVKPLNWPIEIYRHPSQHILTISMHSWAAWDLFVALDMSGRRVAAALVEPNESKVKFETFLLLMLNIHCAALATGAVGTLSGSGGSKRKFHVGCLFVWKSNLW